MPRCRTRDASRILILTVIAAAASLGAILSELSTAQGATRTGMQLALATITIVLSWTFVHTIFALHYAHEYYGERGGKHDGLNFPGEESRTTWTSSISRSSSA